MATATAKKIELEADTSCYSFDVLCNVAKLYNSSCDSIDTTEIEAEIHNSSCDSIDTWFTAEIKAEINNCSCDSIDTWFTAEIEAEIHNSLRNRDPRWEWRHPLEQKGPWDQTRSDIMPPLVLTSSGSHQSGRYTSYWNASLFTNDIVRVVLCRVKFTET